MIETAQEAYAALLRDHIGPSLRSIGFRGSRRAYTLPHPEYWIRIGVQASAWSDRATVDFTLNISVIPKAGWERLRRAIPAISEEQPAANVFYNAPALGDNSDFWQRRIGQLLPDKNVWWTVQPDTDLTALGVGVMDAVREGVLPAIMSRTGAVLVSATLTPRSN